MPDVDIVDWKLNGTCNLRCLHCYGPPKDVQALPIDELQGIAERISSLGAQWVVLTGGEPLLVEGIEDLMASLDEQRVKISLSTNSMFVRDMQDTIDRYVSSLNLPLDGSTKDIHARSRADMRSYDTFFEVLDWYMEHPECKPPLVRVGTVYSRANKGDLEAIAKKLEPYDHVIDTWKIYEILDYDVQVELRAELLPSIGFTRSIAQLKTRTKVARKIDHAPATGRDKAYFMINPAGYVVIPTSSDGVTHEIPVADIREGNLASIVGLWAAQVNEGNYVRNHKHYGKIGTMHRERGKALAV